MALGRSVRASKAENLRNVIGHNTNDFIGLFTSAQTKICVPTAGVGKNANVMDYAAVLEAGLRTSGLTAAEASRRAVGNSYFLYGILRKGHIPSVEKFESLCNVLGIEFSVGPAHGNAPSVDRPSNSTPGKTTDAPASPAEATPEDTAAAGVSEALRDQMAAILKDEAQAIRELVCEGISDHLHALQDQAISRLAPPADNIEDAGALAVQTVEDGATDVPGARSVRMIEVEAAAGDGAHNLDDAREVGPVWFRRDWIGSRGIDPGQAVVISVRNDSMEPTLPPDCKILVDRHRRRRRVGHIYVIATDDGLIVKRMGKDDDGRWLVVSDNDSPDWPDAPWPDDAEVVGEVKWMAKELP